MERYALRDFTKASPAETEDAMERAEVVFYDRCPLELPNAADLEFMRTGLPRELQVKNISYHPESDSIPRFEAAPEVAQRIERILRAHGQRVEAFLRASCPDFVPNWTLGTTSFRSIEEHGRKLKPRSSNELVHIDAGAYGATNGARILRFFVNIHPDRNRVWGTKNELVLGYKGPADIFIALDRGEVQGVSAAMSTLLVNRAEWIRDNKVALLMQFGLERARELPDLPTAIELAPNPESAEMLRFIGAKFALARPFALPPETPPERVKILRDAYEATLKDPAFLADAKRIGIDITPIDGDTTTKMIHAIQTTPVATIERLRAIINP